MTKEKQGKGENNAKALIKLKLGAVKNNLQLRNCRVNDISSSRM